ncbi:DUF6272 family protein [Leptolyngbya sp. AN02str]|uniref:DUF6272 family protein n=1 Tax=Leptolyngbya sp. AN02str TaxID=3423363 RepID=UPI003D316487
MPTNQPMRSNHTIRVYGETPHIIPESNEYLTLHFSPSSSPRKQRWNNYGLSADFLGDYFAAFFPGDELPDSKINRRDTVKAAVSFIANELLENAVKYNDDSINHPISISLHLYQQRLIFQSINHATTASAERYQQFVQQLVNAEIDELYTQQLEKTAMGTGDSSMGLLTMIYDYSAKFGWQFEPISEAPEVYKVSVLVHLDV